MKSKIMVDVDDQNNPLISVILFRNTGDLRDKILSKFFEDFDYGVFARVIHKGDYQESSSGASYNVIEIRPLSKTKEVKHILTDEDFEINPELYNHGLIVGDSIGVPLQ